MEDDDEYVPPTLIMDTELDYGEIEPEASKVRIRIRITEDVANPQILTFLF
jgi:hypothetical protein